jgi:hypothetical protein
VPSAPLFQQVDFHRQLTDLALQLGNLALVLGDAYRVDYFIGELAGCVFPHPLAEQIARQAMLARQFPQTHPPLQKVEHHLTLELHAEPSMPCHDSISSKPARLVQSIGVYLSN